VVVWGGKALDLLESPDIMKKYLGI
jgi:hypothetical protein